MNADIILLQPTRLIGVVRLLGTSDTLGRFYRKRWQKFCRLHGWLYRHIILHWRNARVRVVVRSSSLLSTAA